MGRGAYSTEKILEGSSLAAAPAFHSFRSYPAGGTQPASQLDSLRRWRTPSVSQAVTASTRSISVTGFKIFGKNWKPPLSRGVAVPRCQFRWTGNMVDEAALRRAVDTYSLVPLSGEASRLGCRGQPPLFAAAPPSRKMGSARERDRRTDRLRPGLLEQSPQRRMLRLMEKLVRQLVVSTARPGWTLLIISEVVSAAIMLVLRSMFAV